MALTNTAVTFWRRPVTITDAKLDRTTNNGKNIYGVRFTWRTFNENTGQEYEHLGYAITFSETTYAKAQAAVGATAVVVVDIEARETQKDGGEVRVWPTCRLMAVIPETNNQQPSVTPAPTQASAPAPVNADGSVDDIPF